MELFNRQKSPQKADKALVVQITLPLSFAQYSEQECVELAASAGANVIHVWRCQVDVPHARSFIGRGQVENLCAEIEQNAVGLVFFNTTLSPSQERNLSRQLNCRVIDRVSLILDIFALRAQTHEGRLQVELAQLKHLSTRLIRGWTHLERQKGGIGLRGPGETQLETDRRLLNIRIKRLQNALEKVQKRRELGRNRRNKNNIPCVALVGYTNAGKSSLFNALCQTDIYATDQLFATLDTTIRQIHLTGVGSCLLIDTVGFIQNLPPDLIAAFRSTLEESLSADLLLHVIDVSDSDWQRKELSVQQTLNSIGAKEVPVLCVYNKIDVLSASELSAFMEVSKQENGEAGDKKKTTTVMVSAQKNIGLTELNGKIAHQLSGKFMQAEFILGQNYGQLRSQLFALGEVLSEDYSKVNPKIYMRLSRSAFAEIIQHPEIKKATLQPSSV